MAQPVLPVTEGFCALTSSYDRGNISSAVATRYLPDIHRELIGRELVKGLTICSARRWSQWRRWFRLL